MAAAPLMAAMALAACSPAPTVAVPPVVTTVAGPPLTVAASGAPAAALWQAAALAMPRVAGGLVIGLVPGSRPPAVRALSATTGRPAWTATLPAGQPAVLGLTAVDGTVVVQAGHDIGHGPAEVRPVVATLEVLDAGTGHRLWSTAADGDTQSVPVAVVAGLVATGDAAGTITARSARTGTVVWRRARPAPCPSALAAGYDEALAADEFTAGAAPTAGNRGTAGDAPTAGDEANAGNGATPGGGAASTLLVASYRCRSGIALAQRLEVGTGRPAWVWRSWPFPAASPDPAAGPTLALSVQAAAVRGGVVVLAGALTGGADLAGVPRRYAWPPVLGPISADQAVVALDAATGAGRWVETGGQPQQAALTGGAVCETVPTGFECRDDRTGAPTVAPEVTGQDATASPPYAGDGYAGIAAGYAAVALPPGRGGSATEPARGGAHPPRGGSAAKPPRAGGGVPVLVLPVDGSGAPVRLAVGVGGATRDGSNYQTFVVAAGALPDGHGLFLLRRVDEPDYPLVALRLP